MASWHRRKGFRFQGMDLLFLTTVGRSSGTRRETPVAWFPAADDAWLVVASAAGSAAHPSWYRNIAANPDQVWVELPGRKLKVNARELHDRERTVAWQQITTSQPRFAKYQQKTDRELPVIRLSAAA